jgi:hypothetical protein
MKMCAIWQEMELSWNKLLTKLATLLKNCKMTMYVPTFAKHVDEEDQHGGKAYFKS